MRTRLVPAAQYLRMSTENQEYSLVNQAEAIANYAARNGFVVVKSYEDAGRSGLVLRERPGLRGLLADVVKPGFGYEAILVYDVSRWGRFQDSDEAATYEFLCRQAGAPVHYCAESFSNDLSVPSSIMKALKRSMAAEYSRELGLKCYAGQKRLAQMGFKMGGTPGYGLRRMLVSRDRKRITALGPGEYKWLSTDRIVLVPGPKQEVETVRRIFAMLLGGIRPADMARKLNREKVKYTGGRSWNFYSVSRILRSQKYAGANVWGQTDRKLHSKPKSVPKKDWVCVPAAFAPIVDLKTYQRAQRILDNTAISKSNTELLNDLRRLLRRKGYLSLPLIEKAHKSTCHLASPSCYYQRFGSLWDVYKLVGYDPRHDCFQRRARAMVTQYIRHELMQVIVNKFPNRITIQNTPPKQRGTLLVDGSVVVSVILVRAGHWPNGKPAWRYYPTVGETENVTLLCIMNQKNDDIERYYLFRRLGRSGTYKFGMRSKWLRQGVRLSSVSEFCDALARIIKQ